MPLFTDDPADAERVRSTFAAWLTNDPRPTCAHCRERFDAPQYGRVPKFCSSAHRQAAYRKRKNTGVGH